MRLVLYGLAGVVCKRGEKAKKKAGIFEERLFHVMAAASRLLPAASSNQPTTKLFQNENATKVNIFSNLKISTKFLVHF